MALHLSSVQKRRHYYWRAEQQLDCMGWHLPVRKGEVCRRHRRLWYCSSACALAHRAEELDLSLSPPPAVSTHRHRHYHHIGRGISNSLIAKPVVPNIHYTSFFVTSTKKEKLPTFYYLLCGFATGKLWGDWCNGFWPLPRGHYNNVALYRIRRCANKSVQCSCSYRYWL